MKKCTVDLCRPLYIVGAGELGTDPSTLDTALTKQNFMTNLIPAGQLTVLKTVQPVYPSKAEGKKLEGWVDVEFTVTEAGRVQDVAVRAASVPGVFDDAAVKAVSQWRYQPTLLNGNSVEVETTITVSFVLGG